MASREGGHPGPEQKNPPVGKKEGATDSPAQEKKEVRPDTKSETAQNPGHSPAEARIKSFEQTVGPDGTVRVKKEYYDTVPEPVSATETARAKAAEGSSKSVEAKVKVGETSAELSAKAEKEPDAAKKADAEKEKAKEDGTSGAAIVEAVKKDPETPKEVKEALKDSHNAKEAAAAVEEKSVFGQRAKNFIRRFGTGMAAVGAKAGIKFLAKRTLDFGTVGAGAVAGGLVGGGVEGIKAYRAESKRLYDLKTYKDALAGYDSMTNLDKVTAIIALEEKLKKRFSGRILKPEEHLQLQNLKLELRQKLEVVAGKDKAAEKKDIAKLEKLLNFRGGEKPLAEKDEKEKGRLEKFKELWKRIKVSKNESGKENGLLDRMIGMANLMEERGKLDAEMLMQEQSKEVKGLLEKFYKERGLQRNGKKIAWETVKGAVFGAAGGAFGAWAFDHAAHFAADHGWISQKLVSHEVIKFSPNAEHAGAPALGAVAVDASHTVAPGAETIIHVPSAEDVQHMHGNVWNTVKEYMVSHGVVHPSNAEINSGMMAIAKANAVEIDAHHLLDPNHAGHMEEALRKFLDTKMQAGTSLGGFDSLKPIVEHAGGHALGAQEIISRIPAGVLAKEGAKGAAKEAAKQLAEQGHSLRNILAILGLGGGVAYLVRRNNKKAEQLSKEMSLNIGKTGKQAETAAAGPALELIGNETELKTATLERRLQLLNKVKERILILVAQAGAHLNGDKPNVFEFRKAMKPLDDALGDKQFNLLVLGASEEDKEKIGAAWDLMIDELNAVAKPFEDKAKELEEAAAKEVALEEQQDSDGGPEEVNKPEVENEEKKEGWTSKYAEGYEKIKDAENKAEKALKDGNTELATSHHLEMAAAIAVLAVFAKGLAPKEKKYAVKQIKILQEKADGLHKKIEALEKKQGEAKDTTMASSKAAPEDKVDKRNEAEKLGLEPWRAKLYHRMVDLKLMSPLRDGEKFQKGGGNLHRLDKFALFTKEDGGLFKSLTAGGAKGWQTRFFEALTDLKEGKQGSLKDFCLALLKKGYDLNKEDKVDRILDEMSIISAEVAKAIDDAKFDFVRPARKTAKVPKGKK